MTGNTVVPSMWQNLPQGGPMLMAADMHPAGFDTIMPKTIATATVDRLLHHAHVVLTECSSHRLAEATAGKGVIALT